MIKIVHASIDENKRAKGGLAGDQTGKEVCVRDWYSKPWEFVLRHPNENIAHGAANIAYMLADSQLVGYDQNERNSLYNKLKEFGFSVGPYIASGIKTETDCSAFVTACYVCAGIKTLQYSGNAPTTSTMKKVYKSAGFNVLDQAKFLKTDDFLKKGDILVKPGSHTVICLESGARDGLPDTDIYYYQSYTGSSDSIVTALACVGVKDTSKAYRKKIAEVNGIANYSGTAAQNQRLLKLLKEGYLIKPF